MVRLFVFLGAIFFSIFSNADTLHVYFPSDEAFLNANTGRQLDKIVESLKGEGSLLLIGYADEKGDKYYNDMLSMRRAQSVAKYLQQKGIEEHTIKLTIGKGEIINWAENGNTASRKDRRVDIVLKRSKVKAAETVKETPKQPKKEKPAAINEVKVGETIALKNIQFLPGIVATTKESKPELERLYQQMKENENLVIQIEGHICCNPEPANDTTRPGYRLSLGRAHTVYSYLLNKGIAADRMAYKGFSSWKPLVPEINEENEAKNRRVEIRVMKK